MTKKNFKYTIHGFQQQKLIEQGLDNNDALVMSVVRDMYSSASIEHKIIDGDRYIWVSQTALSEYVPIIGTLRTLQRIFKKLLNKGVFESRVLNGRKGKTGKYFYVKPNKLLEDLTEYVAINQELDQATNCRMNKRQNVIRSSDKMSLDQATKCRNKDTPNNDTSNSDTPNIYTEEKPPTPSVVESVREENSKPFIINRLIEHGVDKRLAEEYWHYRTTIKRDRPTNRAISLLINECISSNFNISEAIKLTIANGWKGFKVQWVQNQQQQAGRPQQVSKREAVEAHNARIAAELIAEIQGGAQ